MGDGETRIDKKGLNGERDRDGGNEAGNEEAREGRKEGRGQGGRED